MKHTLEEIEKRLAAFKQMAINKLDFEMLEIISDLVEELKETASWLEASRKANQALGLEIKDLKEENKRLREALEGLTYSDGCFCEVSIGNPMYLDHSNSCKNARKALEGK